MMRWPYFYESDGLVSEVFELGQLLCYCLSNMVDHYRPPQLARVTLTLGSLPFGW